MAKSPSDEHLLRWAENLSQTIEYEKTYMYPLVEFSKSLILDALCKPAILDNTQDNLVLCKIYTFPAKTENGNRTVWWRYKEDAPLVDEMRFAILEAFFNEMEWFA